MKLEIKSGQLNKKKKMAIKEDKQQDRSKSNSPLVIDDKVTSLNENQLSVKSISPSDNQCKVTILLSNRDANTTVNNNISKDLTSSNKTVSSSNSINHTSNVLTNVTASTNSTANSILNLSTLTDTKSSINNLSNSTAPNLSNLSTSSLLNANSLNLNSSVSSKTPISTKFSIANILKNKSESLLANDLPADLGKSSKEIFD